MQKLFDQWNELKQKINSDPTRTYPFFYNREVWWCSIGMNIGYEINGKHEPFERPVLILCKFNKYLLWIVPLTSKYHEGPHFYRVVHEKGVSFACLSQSRVVSSKRLIRKIGMVNEHAFRAVRALIARYLLS